MKRRTFVKNTSTAAVALALAPKTISLSKNQINVGVIGVGARGLGHLGLLLRREDVSVTAICDIDDFTLNSAAKMIDKSGKKQPKVYKGSDLSYQELIKDKNVDAVIIATPWHWHVPMAVDAMMEGKAVGMEVSGSTSVEECWNLVRTYEKTKTPLMFLENVCYRRDVMAILNMVRKDVFGELVHLQGGYEHDLREVKFNDGKQWYGGGVEFGEKGMSEAKWRTHHSVARNGDLYPTHGLGPIMTMIDINRGNRLTHLTSMSSKSIGLHNHIVNHPKGGKDHPNAKIKFELGDIVTTMIRTSNDETILLTHDTNLPRPYSLGFRVQGAKGIWMDVNDSIYIEGKSDSHKWSPAKTMREEYDHPLWKKYEQKAVGAGHGGMDFFVINSFIEALKNSEPMQLDVYDAATMKVITSLSEESIAKGSQAVAIPDFTNGKWITRKPVFALNDRY